jgi:hypothetical protein
MAELYTMTGPNQTTVFPASTPTPPEAVPQIAGAGPLWRSLLFPRNGQRAVRFGSDDSKLFASLLLAGIQIERRDLREQSGAATFDLVLDDRTNGGSPVRPERMRSLLVPGGRWVVVLEKKRWVGLAGHRILSRARREGFEAIETFHAYPSLRSPRILVPLDDPEPFRYFLSLAVGVRGPRQRALALAARCLCALRLHRMMLSNLIMVARRGK